MDLAALTNQIRVAHPWAREGGGDEKGGEVVRMLLPNFVKGGSQGKGLRGARVRVCLQVEEGAATDLVM